MYKQTSVTNRINTTLCNEGGADLITSPIPAKGTFVVTCRSDEKETLQLKSRSGVPKECWAKAMSCPTKNDQQKQSL